MALDALKIRSLTKGCVPKSVPAAMNTYLPIAINNTVALRAQHGRLVAGDFRSIMIQVDVAVFRIVAMEAVLVKAVRENDVGMLISEGVYFRVIAVAVVAHRTFVGVAVSV